MKAIQLTAFSGPQGLHLVDVSRPTPQANEILIKVDAAGINFAEFEMTYARYSAPRPLPFTMGFEAAGTVVEVGPQVTSFHPGDRVTSIVKSGGFAEYAIADSSVAIPIPEGISFAQATAIPIQGLTAITLLKLAARPRLEDTILIQAAAGGVGLFLVQLARHIGVRRIIALAGSDEKLSLVRKLGADFAFNYNQPGWTDDVLAATGGNGPDLIFESVSGSIADQSFQLLAPFGRIIFFGARNAHDTLPSEKVRQLILKNQTLVGFNFPSLPPYAIAASIPELLDLIASSKIKLFAEHSFPLHQAREAFDFIGGRRSIGKLVLLP